MLIETVNPASGEVIQQYETMAAKEVFGIAERCAKAQAAWRKLPLPERSAKIADLAAALRSNRDRYARLMTLEMGKTLAEARAEVEKCAWMADVYAERGEEWLADEGEERAEEVAREFLGKQGLPASTRLQIEMQDDESDTFWDFFVNG